MRVPGYCERCHKIKHVRANSAAMVRLAMNQPIFGICSSCEEDERLAAQARHPAYRDRR